HHPEIELSLQGFESISALNLLSLIQHCQDLVFIVDNREYHLKDEGTHGRLLKQLLQKEGYHSLVTALLLSGAHLGFTRGRQSPLHLAIQEGKETVVHDLIRYGAALNQLDSEGKSPLDLAVEGYNSTEKLCYQTILLMLITQGAM